MRVLFLVEVVADDPSPVTCRLNRPQPALLALLASGQSPVYPCHVSAADMRTKPIGTGPFKLVSYRQNSGILVEKNEDYFKEGLPYLDGINYQIIASRSTRSEERRVGKECVRTCRSRWSA